MDSKSLFSNLSLTLGLFTRTDKRRKVAFLLFLVIISSTILYIRWSRAESEFDENRNFPLDLFYRQRSYRVEAGEDADLEIRKKRSKIVEVGDLMNFVQ